MARKTFRSGRSIRRGEQRNRPRVELRGKQGKKVNRKNPRVTMPLKALRRLISSAKKGTTARVKARVH